MLALQAQDERMLPFALKARGGKADGCVITWLMRSTLHLVKAEDVRWLLALTGPRQRAGNERRLRQLGVHDVAQARRDLRALERLLRDQPRDLPDGTLGDVVHAELPEPPLVPRPLPRAREREQRAGNTRRLEQLGVDDVAERAVAQIARLVAQRPLKRAEIAARLDVPTDGQRIVHLLHRAALDGAIAMTPQREFAPLDDLAPPLREDDLGARFLAARPGASPEDLARWSGLPLKLAREALRDAPEPRPRRGELGTTYLPAYDELLLSWVDRSPTIPPELEPLVYPGGGVLRPIVLRDGVAIGTWSLRGGKIIASAGA